MYCEEVVGCSLLARPTDPDRQVTTSHYPSLPVPPALPSTAKLSPEHNTLHRYVLSMGNQLSTWNLTIQSAVRGPSFDEFPEYNQQRLFSDYTWFYIGIGCTAGVALLLILFNFVLGCVYK